jgi:hypothetical protein
VQRFTGTGYLLEDPDSVFAAEVDLDLNNIAIKADGTEIGCWKQAAVSVVRSDELVHLIADGETLVLDLESRDFFLDMIEVEEPEPVGARRRRAPRYKPEGGRQFSLADIKTQMLEASADRIDRTLAIVMVAAAIAILLGAALSWGPFRILDPGSFPIGRVLAAFGGLGGLLGVYLAYTDRNRVTGSAAAIAAGIVTFCIVYIYARSARLGIGFVLTLLGSQGLVAVGVLGIVRSGNDS